MNRSKKLTWAALGATLLAAGTIMPLAHAQSSDALLDKLVDKGVLTVKEANELREEADAGFHKAYQAKTGMPDWVNQLKIYGDVRGRVELFRFDNDTSGAGEPNKDRTRYRYRLRVGTTVTMKDDFELGFRLTSSEPNGTFGGDPISGNTTLQDNGSKKFVYIDLAYGKWTPIHHGPWLLGGTVGKMENPFVVSDSVFDADYTPEGAAIQGGYTFNDSHSIKWNGALFALDEINQGSQASNDPFLYGLQLRYDAKWSPKLSSSLGVAWYALSEEENLGNAAVPNINIGNTRNAAGNLVNNYDPIVVDAAITYNLDSFPLYTGPFPLRVAGEFMHNPGASKQNDAYWAGLFIGKSGKKGLWEVSYRYKHQEADSWYEEFVDSDFGAYYQFAGAATGSVPVSAANGTSGYKSGTGTEGHIIKASYSPSDSFTIGITYFLTELISPKAPGIGSFESGQHRIQIDAVWKF